MHVVLHRFPVDPRRVIAVALVLVLVEPRLEQYHRHGPDIALEGVGVRHSRLQLQRIGQFGREVEVGGVPFGDERVVVGLAASRQRVVHLDHPLLRNQNGRGTQGLVFDALLLEVTHTHDATRQDRPQLLLLEPPLLQVALADLLLEGALGKLEQSVYFVKCRTVLVL